jgi:hypothetical protein
MERQLYFHVYYKGELMCTMCAHSNFEAVDRAFFRYVSEIPNLERSGLFAKKLR